MSVLSTVKYPSKILKKKAKPVIKVTGDIIKLLDDMAETMYAAPGVGLAAPQVGIGLRLIVVDTGIQQPDGSRAANLVQLVNPEITSSEGEIEWEEGCLSIPEFTNKMKRSAKIRVKASDKAGKAIGFEAEGLFAVAIQHEIDHLNGILIIDAVSRLRRKMYLKEMKKKGLKNKEPVYL